jgi:hypothetical protein
VLDCDKVFTSSFWKELFTLAQVQLRMSFTYHPQFDGQTEIVNQCLETFLRCFVSACPKQWVKSLSLVEYWYNTSFHLAIGMSPFEAIYGCSPRSFGLSAPQHPLSAGLEQWTQERAVVTRLIKQHLIHAAALMMF